MTPTVDVESDQHVNICSFVVRYDRGGLALNDIGFILVQAMCPTSSLSRSATLFLSQVLKVCSGVTNEKEKDGDIRGLVGLQLEGTGVMGAPL